MGPRVNPVELMRAWSSPGMLNLRRDLLGTLRRRRTPPDVPDRPSAKQAMREALKRDAAQRRAATARAHLIEKAEENG
jgi:hypothetical protein